LINNWLANLIYYIKGEFFIILIALGFSEPLA